jgi:hypothetical protein
VPSSTVLEAIAKHVPTFLTMRVYVTKTAHTPQLRVHRSGFIDDSSFSKNQEGEAAQQTSSS